MHTLATPAFLKPVDSATFSHCTDVSESLAVWVETGATHVDVSLAAEVHDDVAEEPRLCIGQSHSIDAGFAA
jgi:hypothetical protein